MFYENNNNWSSGEKNGFETFVAGIIFILLVSMIIMIFYTPSKTSVSGKAKPSVPIENKNIQDIKEVNDSKSIDIDTNYNHDNTIDIRAQERQAKKEQRVQAKVEKRQQKQEAKLQKKQEKLEQKAEKQRLKEEKRQQKSDRKNKDNTKNELPNIDDSVGDIPQETEQ